MKRLPERTVAVFNEGDSVFVVDDHCYVLKNWIGPRSWVNSAHLFREAVGVLRGLPVNPDEARVQMAEASSKLSTFPALGEDLTSASDSSPTGD